MENTVCKARVPDDSCPDILMDGNVEEAAKLDITPSEHEPFTIFHEGTANTFVVVFLKRH